MVWKAPEELTSEIKGWPGGFVFPSFSLVISDWSPTGTFIKSFPPLSTLLVSLRPSVALFLAHQLRLCLMSLQVQHVFSSLHQLHCHSHHLHSLSFPPIISDQSQTNQSLCLSPVTPYFLNLKYLGCLGSNPITHIFWGQIVLVSKSSGALDQVTL